MLLETDILVIDQVTAVFRSDFAIYDPQGEVIGQIQTVGGAGQRMLLGNRQFVVYDGQQPSFTINDIPDFGRDTFDIATPDGQALAKIVKQVRFFKRRLDVVVSDGSRLVVRGSWPEYRYEIDSSRGRVANVGRSWPGTGAMLLGRDRYVIAFAPNAPALLRQTVIGTAIAIDRIRAKGRN